MNEVDVLLNEGKTIQLSSGPVAIKPYVFDQFLQVAKIVNSARQKLTGLTYEVTEKEDGTRDIDFDIINLIANAGEEAKMLICISLKKDADEVGAFPLDDVAAVLGTIIEVNLDFFTKKVMPQVTGALQGVLTKVG